jgi:YggT family protein
VDLSPLLVLLAIIFLQKFVVSSLFDIVHRIKFGFGG